MAKTVRGFETDDDGRVQEFAHKVTRHQRASEAQLIGWTEGPTTRRQKIARALWG